MKRFDEKFKQMIKDGVDEFRFGHYYLEGRLAHGGMAEVFVGRDLELGDHAPRCVVKCILPDLAGNTDFLAMFLNEAQLAAQMDHPHIVKVLDFGEHEGLLYMAMEYVDGMDCWRFSRRGMPISGDRSAIAVYIVMMVLDALEYAHGMTDVNGYSLGVVHRDLSPSNIYLGRNGDVKLGDFGIAEIKSSRYREITYIPQGKFGYVSPEQLEGLPLDRRADIFAMGIVLSELLLGKRIFKGVSQLSVLLEIREGRFDVLEQDADRIDPELLVIIYRALARDPGERFQTAADFRQHLEDYYIGHGTATAGQLAAYVSSAVETQSMSTLVSAAAPDIAESDDLDIPSLTPTGPSAIASLSPADLDDLQDEEDETPTTLDVNHPQGEWSYHLRLSENRNLGPFTFAQMMELIYRNEIDGNTLVSLNGRPFSPAEQLPELNRHIPVYTPTLDLNDLESPDKRGVFTVEAPAEVVLSLALANETGLLVCKEEMSRKEVYFQSGKPIYVSSNDPRELLGEYLVEKGGLDREELDMALEVLPKFDGHMGDTLIALGMISAVDLFRSIGDQMRDRFVKLLAWRQGVYEFYRNVLCRQNAPEIPLDAFAFVCEGLMTHAQGLDAEAVFAAMKDGVISQSPQANELLKRLSLSSGVGKLLWEVSDPGTVAALRKSYSDDLKTLVSALYVGLETGTWIVDGVTPPWRE